MDVLSVWEQKTNIVFNVLFFSISSWIFVKLFLFSMTIYRMHKMTSTIPGPKWKDIQRIWKARRSLSKASDVFQDVLKENKPVMKFWSGPALFVITMHPDDFQFILTSKNLSDKARAYKLIQPFQGLGVLHLGGEKWKRHRKILTPFLHSEVLKNFVEVFSRKSTLMADKLKQFTDSEKTINLYQHVALATSDMICETVLSTNMDIQKNEEIEIMEGIDQATLLMIYRVMHPWFLSDTVFFWFSKYYADYKRLVKVFNRFTDRMITIKKAEKKSYFEKECRPSSFHFWKRRTFLDLMLDSPENASLTDLEIREEVKTLLTVASAVHILGFILVCLSLRSDIQQKCYEELLAVFGEKKNFSAPSPDDLPRLLYLERVIKEALRLFPPIPFFGREVKTDMKLPSGYTVPAGAQLVMCSNVPHRDGQYFPDPNNFDPDRFLPEKSVGRHPFAYIPFSAGIRNCMGQRYAMMQLKTTLVVLLHHYEFLPGDFGPQSIQDIKINLAITLSARGGYNVRIKNRKTKNNS